ncbi:ATP-dependent helicase [Metallibacterium sp.]|uniref:ATP-dependent helicase n=1 Tax=Metallibacterium sp. TaxID=2940281 RepID=UPI002632B131|nr:ATP-dependent helicase [Metallibacterium sp.]
MTLFAIEGAAGCGKTVRLIAALREALSEAPLRDGQRVLALTFMHGARRRLHDKLRDIVDLRGRLHCVTVDSFAQRLVMRWRGLGTTLGVTALQPDQYDEQCDAAGLLLEQSEVAGWVAASFPIVLVDEAQDLKPQRLRMISALTGSTRLMVAADDFQCLDPSLRPSPCVIWLRQACTPVELTQIHRTSMSGLLTAAAAIRAGNAPADGQGFKILAAKGLGMAAVFLANAIAWRHEGEVAVITPSMSGGFAQGVVACVGKKALGKKQNGPYTIHWERSEENETDALLAEFQLGDSASLADTITALRQLPASGVVRGVMGWARRQAHAAGVTSFNRAEVAAAVRRHVVLRRQHAGSNQAKFAAMTVQQAKNREFEGVVVLWPYQVGGDAEHKRRLLYNAITRARRWCTVVLQSENLLRVAPFA